jgi:hypothetical protein
VDAVTALTQFTVADDTREVFCCTGGAYWVFLCNDKACTGKRFVGWDDGISIAGAAGFHLQWHANGMPQCRHCGADLAKPRKRTCPRGECSERDGGR